MLPGATVTHPYWLGTTSIDDAAAGGGERLRRERMQRGFAHFRTATARPCATQRSATDRGGIGASARERLAQGSRRRRIRERGPRRGRAGSRRSPSRAPGSPPPRRPSWAGAGAGNGEGLEHRADGRSQPEGPLERPPRRRPLSASTWPGAPQGPVPPPCSGLKSVKRRDPRRAEAAASSSGAAPRALWCRAKLIARSPPNSINLFQFMSESSCDYVLDLESSGLNS